MTQQQADHFAQAWIDAFNAHDPEAILAHYADKLTFSSPFIPLLTDNASGVITAKSELADYFLTGLATYPDLHFTLHHVFAGIDSLAIHYTSVNNRQACEVFRLNEAGKAVHVSCHYVSTSGS
nr:nuclear transport factor 2 family protein [uncultured Arsenicibacter sp.]